MSDLRRSAIEVKRDHDHKAKWAHGARVSQHHIHDPALPFLQRPAGPLSQAVHTALRRTNEGGIKRARHAAQAGFHHDVKEALTSDSSADEGAHHESVAPGLFLGDGLAAYAASGENVLSAAISTAEVKYENKVTEKLVQEYELVSKDDEVATGCGYVADIDDFEVIDHNSV
ncbi:hypothetical protein BGW36DRAFT_364691 [Talaromyces proteolyticus]|uniref:Uncharacterized protein n=1 Tax=Talaromyces proteolyticus TaxID=1131652 RepID=A0AAD4KED7_9EURO|nr:uncharacterized protein BGW36DRAFT_364691 [Talaromyces proteolyticus]KAH8689955.1 hypothetical protein BGW36DRAFT_364691 [Talaromyces proteolyticus]